MIQRERSLAQRHIANQNPSTNAGEPTTTGPLSYSLCEIRAGATDATLYFDDSPPTLINPLTAHIVYTSTASSSPCN